MKSIYFAITIAMLVFSACSDDKEESKPGSSSSSSSGMGGCLIKSSGINIQCIEEGGIYGTKEVCSHMGEWVDSCPPGTKCEVESSDGIKFIATFYDVVPSSCNP